MSFVSLRGASPAIVDVIKNNLIPEEAAVAPDMPSRRAAVSFTTAANNENVVLGTITYTFKTTLGSPAANNVEVKVQGSVTDSIKMLALAIRGETDATNIAYGSGVTANDIASAYWTGVRFAVGSTAIAAGDCLFILEIAEDSNAAITLTSTTTCNITAFTRVGYARYVMNGNDALDGTKSVRGSYQTVLPINSIKVGGQSGTGELTTYLPVEVFAMGFGGLSGGAAIEVDIYYSLDESTFTRIARSSPIVVDAWEKVEIQSPRIPAGAGMYVKMATDDETDTDFMDFKLSYQVFPAGI